MRPGYSVAVHKRGFTLIQMSILLTVAALVMVSVLPGREAGDVNQKTVTNIYKLQKVEAAMRGFMAFNGRRPCPADGQYDINDHKFGLEADTPGNCTDGAGANGIIAPMGPDAGTSHIVGGTIPTKSLGLPDDYAFDEYGRRFTYVVDQRATKKASCAALEGISLTNTTPTGTGGIKIESATGITPEIDDVMYAYISHGPSGHGAFPPQGSGVGGRINNGSTDQDKNTNAGASNDGNMTYSTANFTNVKIKKDKTSTFDDLVYYRSDIKNTCCLGPQCIPIGFRIDGQYAGTQLGNQTWVGGGILFADINGDGIPDLVISGYNAYTGHYGVYVVFGQHSNYVWPDPLNVSTLDGTNGFYADGVDSWGTNWPMPMTTMDFNGDGIADLVLSNLSAGTYILFGQATPFPATFSLNTLSDVTNPKGMTISGVANNNSGGLIAVGDINGDGIDDLVISNTNQAGADYQRGQAYVIFGMHNPPATFSLYSLFPGFTPPANSYATFTTVPFTVTAGSHTISFIQYAFLYSNSYIDNVVINGSATQFTDPGFETPAQGNGNATNCPVAGSAWTFSPCDGGSYSGGLIGNGGVWWSGGIPNAPEGNQAAFLIDGNIVSQAVTLAAGTYTVSFDALAPSGGTIAVSVDGQILNNTNGNLGFILEGSLFRGGLARAGPWAISTATESKICWSRQTILQAAPMRGEEPISCGGILPAIAGPLISIANPLSPPARWLLPPAFRLTVTT